MMTTVEERMIETYTGRFIDPLSPDPEAICIEDIAHALSNICRFNGHTSRHYSVAEHSRLVACVLDDWGCDKPTVLYGLMHDAAEAYLCDLVSPVKHNLFGDQYRAAEAELIRVIAKRFNFSDSLIVADEAAAVDRADEILLWCEASELLKSGGCNWGGYGPRIARLLSDYRDVCWMIRERWAVRTPLAGEEGLIAEFVQYGGVR